MQGVAILLMIFYHLFNTHVTNEYQNTILENLAKANNPVPFYVFLSGYGLFCVSKKGVDKNKYARCIKIYLHYWIITAIFIIISLFLHARTYDFSLANIMNNVVGIHTDYYASAWFILPYIILSYISPFIFKILNTYNNIILLLLSYIIYLVAAYLNRYDFFSSNIFQVLYIQFSFVLGAVFAKHNIINKIKQRVANYPPLFIWILFLLVIAIRYYFPSGTIISFYAAIIISLVVAIKKHKWVKTILSSLGKASLNMWMIHTWIFSYLFSKEIYGIGNPILMFTIVTAVSFLLSKLFDVVLHPITRTLLR